MAPAFATPVAISNSSVLAGVNDYGTLGSNGNTPPGILFDATATSNYGVNDFLTPGTPWEGFYITANGGVSQYSNNTTAGGYHGGTTFSSTSPISLTGSSATWTGTSFDGSMTVTNTYSLTTVSGRSVIAVNTTVTNNSDSALTGLQFLRAVDPDPDVNAFGSYYTANTIISNSQACGTGPSSGQTICVFTTDDTFTHNAGISGYYSGTDGQWSRIPADYLAGMNDGDGDYAIGLAFNVGTLGGKQSVSLKYGYALGGSLDVTVTPPVPEPEAYGLLLAGLAVVGAIRRRRA
ncbi:MAG: PEP-CTERM sorting domain-containing protein [Acidobacteriota bacterium]